MVEKIHSSSPFDGVSDELLFDCLLTYQEGTVGFNAEVDLIRILNVLCKQHGYGRVPQIAGWIEDIWRNPENIGEHKKASMEQRELLKKAQRYYNEQKQKETNSSGK